MDDIHIKSTVTSLCSDSSNSHNSILREKLDTEDREEQWSSANSFASFIGHFAHLEERCRAGERDFFDAGSEVFGPRLPLGEGSSFSVERSEWRNRDTKDPLSDIEKRRGQYVALKRVRPSRQADLGRLLLEARALLHKPLCYHPNIVRLLGLGWDQAPESNSLLPLLVMEYAGLGSLRSLQEGKPKLPFAVKQKLCYDVAKGLSILHACGFIHGDLRHENVLVFETHEKQAPYTAKLADFGGSMMDIAEEKSCSPKLGTWPYNPPEPVHNLSIDGSKQSDVYCFGLLVWRVMIDGKDILDIPELKGVSIEEIQTIKLSDYLGAIAEKSIRNQVVADSLSEKQINIVFYVLDHTIQAEPSMRSLSRGSAALKGLDLHTIEDFLKNVARKNELIGNGLFYRRRGEIGLDYDAQDDCPGYRPELGEQEAGKFLFDPQRLKAILSWKQQKQVVADLERAAATQSKDAVGDLKPWMAAYYAFQCYLTEFGVFFDPQKVCHWLAQATAAAPEDEEAFIYHAQAWLRRIRSALGIPAVISRDSLQASPSVSTVRDYLTGAEGDQTTIGGSNPEVEPEGNTSRHKCLEARTYLVNWRLRRDYDLDHLDNLDNQIKEELGADYAAALSYGLPWNVELESRAVGWRTFDKIAVSDRGHGLLHLAASQGNLPALKHLVMKYKAYIDLADPPSWETPLVSACIGGHFDCVVFLLDRGASPSGHVASALSPLHWLCNFQEDEMPTIAKWIKSTVSSIDGPSRSEQADVRNEWADWEEMYTVCVTPLGRAVIMKSLPAVRTLLALGADPLARPSRSSNINAEEATSAIDLAVILMLPDILEVLLVYIDARSGVTPRVFDECEMLKVAHDKLLTPCDPTSLQSRLIRCGANYKRDLFTTLQMLRNREQEMKCWQKSDECRVDGKLLCEEVKLGNTDIVEALLQLGHSASGSSEYRPIVEAVKLNHEAIFRLLIAHGADLSTKIALADGSQVSLPEISAGRPSTSRPGQIIASYLSRLGAVDGPNLSPLPSTSAKDETHVLPPSWEMKTTPEGRVYYVNHKQRITTWERPSESRESIRKSLPDGWELRVCGENGRFYYVDHNTRTTSWVVPVRGDPSTSKPLPAGWERRSTTEGRIYFVDHNTKSCQWDCPDVAAANSRVDADTQTEESEAFLIVSSPTKDEGSNGTEIGQKMEKASEE